MIIIDTSVWVGFICGNATWQTDWLMRNLDRPNLGLTDLTYCEILQGQKTDVDVQRWRYALPLVGVHATGGIELAEATAQNYRSLRRRGLTIRNTIDCFIATFCIRGGHTLLHSDRDFIAFEQHLALKVFQH